jgi:radical SAM/Cys-rich protein
MLDVLPFLIDSDFPSLRREAPKTLQVNLGRLCNQQCLHCHVAAGPNRKEVMDPGTLDLVLSCLDRLGGRGLLGTLDITGGAPELNPGFRRLVVHARGLGLEVIDRCNLSILLEPGQTGLPSFLAQQGVAVVASLPCYLAENVDAQRGRGVFQKSLQGIRLLNDQGYGDPDSGLTLDLVYNPQGPTLPPPQTALEADYRRILERDYGITFNRLLTLANLPIGRFGSGLLSKGELGDYVRRLKAAHRPENTREVMCKSLISVDWEGWLYDCDFNQMLGLSLSPPEALGSRRVHLRDLLEHGSGGWLDGLPIRVADHCYGCTAGQGSSCGGALS